MEEHFTNTSASTTKVEFVNLDIYHIYIISYHIIYRLIPSNMYLYQSQLEGHLCVS